MSNRAIRENYNLEVGNLIRVHLRILEGDKERIQIFEGLVIGIKGRGENKTFTVRKIAAGNIGVERIFPLNSPWIVKLETKKEGRVRRAKLKYVRNQTTRQVAQVTQNASS